ncbi:GL11469 [Drosophila persimilis]|uniref:GL11469 n=1 Tax=Drosophila persimilis TaxID=7234 RepID=B4GAZ8_DROPE|nr:GL11469 [Drosophila persimilis]
MKMSIFGELNTFELLVLSSLLPGVFVFLWTLITGDIKVVPKSYLSRNVYFHAIFLILLQNFKGSKLAYSEFTAQDPINCYQNYGEKKDKDS